jgi:hypothetical protein
MQNLPTYTEKQSLPHDSCFQAWLLSAPDAVADVSCSVKVSSVEAAVGVFRKANGFWPNDNIQSRNTVLLPVDACSVKGRPNGSLTAIFDRHAGDSVCGLHFVDIGQSVFIVLRFLAQRQHSEQKHCSSTRRCMLCERSACSQEACIFDRHAGDSVCGLHFVDIGQSVFIVLRLGRLI